MSEYTQKKAQSASAEKSPTDAKAIPPDAKSILPDAKVILPDARGSNRELERLCKELDASLSLDSAGILSRLQRLAALPITLEALMSCKIGLIVNQLRRTSSDVKIVEAATAIVKKWKKLVTTGGTGSGSTSSTAGGEHQKKNLAPKSGKDDSESKQAEENARQKKGSSKGGEDGAAVREHCVSLLRTGLEANSSLSADCRLSAPQLANQIEQEIFLLFKEPNQKYKSQVSVTKILKDSQSNSLLRR